VSDIRQEHAFHDVTCSVRAAGRRSNLRAIS
jgi:hypothetical protein